MKKIFTVLALVAVLVSSFEVRAEKRGVVKWFWVNHEDSPIHVDFKDGRSLTLYKGDEVVIKEVCVLRVHSFGWDQLPYTPPTRRCLVLKSTDALPVGQPVSSTSTRRKKRRVMLMYPPVSSVWHYPLGISQLAAILREEGHVVEQRYGHIIGLEYVLRNQGGSEADEALAAIRDPQSDIQALYSARVALREISRRASTTGKFLVEGNNVVYSSRDNDGTVEGLVRAIKNRETNMWYQYFAEVELPLVEERRPQVYGISIVDERHLIQGWILAAMVKATAPETLVVMGGNYWARVRQAFEVPEFAQLFDYCDAIVYAEGFGPLSELVRSLDPSSTPGTVWRQGQAVVVNPLPAEATSYETLPTPAFDGGARQWSPDDVFPLYTMSNCPMQCGFCAIAAGSDTFLKKPRTMSPQRVVEHMIKLGGRRFDILNELTPVSYQLAIGAELRRRGYGATWQCYLTITNDLLDPARCRQMYEAGCRGVQLGLETLSRDTLLREMKGWNHPENYARILRNLKDAGIQTHVFLLLGLPGELLHHNLRWLPFLEQYGDLILTIKSGRYRLARQSPEEQFGTHNALIELVPDTRPLCLNRNFRYRTLSRQRVEAMRDIIEEACRRHWAYSVTTTIPWWINRGRYTWPELEAMAPSLPPAEPVKHLDEAVAKMQGIIKDELGQKVQLATFDDLLAFARTI